MEVFFPRVPPGFERKSSLIAKSLQWFLGLLLCWFHRVLLHSYTALILIQRNVTNPGFQEITKQTLLKNVNNIQPIQNFKPIADIPMALNASDQQWGDNKTEKKSPAFHTELDSSFGSCRTVMGKNWIGSLREYFWSKAVNIGTDMKANKMKVSLWCKNLI